MTRPSSRPGFRPCTREGLLARPPGFHEPPDPRGLPPRRRGARPTHAPRPAPCCSNWTSPCSWRRPPPRPASHRTCAGSCARSSPGTARPSSNGCRRFGAATSEASFRPLVSDPLFNLALGRLRYNFTLYAFLPVTEGRHRTLTMSFVEPVRWHYQKANLDRTGDAWEYLPMQPPGWDRSPAHVLPRLDADKDSLPNPLSRERGQLPLRSDCAEGCADLGGHSAARGGRRVPGGPLSVDHIRGDSLTTGLHAVEVPPNSLCRAQVLLHVQRAGWLTTLAVSTWAIFLVLFAVAWHAVRQQSPIPARTRM